MLIFFDGDAFPVQTAVPWLTDALGRYPLVAVQRREILDDRRPHPCFCATTVGFWQEIEGDWRRAKWVAPDGRVHDDVGIQVDDRARRARHRVAADAAHQHQASAPRLVRRLRPSRVPPRSRVPPPISRVDIDKAYSGPWRPMEQQSLGMLVTALRRRPSLGLRIRPRHVATLSEAARRTLVQTRKRWAVKRAEKKSDRVFNEILADPSFFRKLDTSAGR